MSTERYDGVGDSFALENEAFRWFQGYEEVLPAFCKVALSRMGESRPEVVKDSIDEYPLGKRLLARLYNAGFSDDVIEEISQSVEPDADMQPVRNVGVEPELALEPEPKLEPRLEPEPAVDTREVCNVRTLPVAKPKMTLPQRPARPTVPVSSRVSSRRVLTVNPVVMGSLTDEMRHQPAWVGDALCAQTDPEAFFPEKGGSTKEAKKVCNGCDVRGDCLEEAQANDERFGIWGGLSERERRKLKSRVI